MKISTLKKMYPNSKLSNKNDSKDDTLVLFDGYQYLNIPRKDLNKNECILLENMFEQPVEMSEWHRYLVGGTTYNDLDIEQVQLIHFKINDTSDIKYEWLISFSHIFEKCIDSFYLEEDYGVVIVEKLAYSEEEMLGILNTLEEDYSVSTMVFIGTLVDKEILQDIFKEEREMFKSKGNNYRVNSFINTYLSHYIVDSVAESKTCQSLKEIITIQKDLPELINSLWQNQGNQSAVAKEIFVHRNTINYRIDKLYEEYGIDLRDMEHLFLCYLLVQ